MLPKEHRLRHDKDIKTLFASAKSVFDPVAGVKFRKNNKGVSRFAVVVGSKVSKKAVVRNRIRRQIRSVLHENLDKIKEGYDVLVLVRPKAVEAKKGEIQSRVLSVLKRAKLM